MASFYHRFTASAAISHGHIIITSWSKIRACCILPPSPLHAQGPSSPAEDTERQGEHPDSAPVDWVATGLCFIFPAVRAGRQASWAEGLLGALQLLQQQQHGAAAT